MLLAAGDKGGVDEKRFYKKLIATADSRFDAYLASLEVVGGGKKPKESSHGKKS